MHPQLRQAYDRELTAGIEHYRGKDMDKAFHHLERAHILGQSFTCAHVKTHWWMLKVGWKRRDLAEVRGQLVRIIVASIISRIWVPVGNTGGTNVHPLKPMPMPDEFQGLLEQR